MRKERNILLAGALLLAVAATAQTEVTTGVMRGKDYGVTYMLPKTEIELTLRATRHTYTPGEFCKYAGRYLHLNRVSTEPSEYWTLDKATVAAIGIPDKENVYFVKMKDKTSAPLMELTEEGIVRSINVPFSDRTNESRPETPAARTPKETDSDAHRHLTEEILMATSQAKRAELVAKEIYSIRESRNALLRGEADNTPKDGAQLKIMIDNLNQQERALTEMFTGTERTESETVTLRITPREMENEVVFRFSKRLGLLAADNLAGEPYHLSIRNLKTPEIPAATEAEDGKKKLDGVAYNVPGRARIVLSHNGQPLCDSELPLTQFGTTEFLAAILFNKNYTIRVTFDPVTGGLLKVDRGE